MTKSYKFGVVETPPRKEIKKSNKSKYDVWDDDYKYNQHQNRIANEKIDEVHLNLMKSLNNAQGEAIERIMKLHKESKQRSAFDKYIEEEQ